MDGELAHPKLPLVPGHQIVGIVEATGARATRFAAGRSRRRAVARLDGRHLPATAAPGRENLCDHARFTGYDIDGGYAEYTVADERFCFPIPAGYPDDQAAPLLCAGLIGYRAYTMAGDARRLGLYGFGDAAHILTQVARHQGREVFAFTRAGRHGDAAVRPQRSARSGRAARTSRRRRSWTRRSSSRRRANWCPPRCGPWTRAAWSSAPGST